MKNRAGRVPRVTRASQNGVENRQQIGPGGLWSDLGRFGALPGASRDAPGTLRDALGTLRDAPGTLPGGLGMLPGRSRNALGRSSDAFGTPRDRFFSQLARGTVFASIWARFFDDLSMIFQSFRGSFFVRLTVDFSIVVQ